MEINAVISLLVRGYPAWSCVPSPVGSGYVAAHSDWSEYLNRERETEGAAL
jgi:hypothetical protein